MPRLLRDLDQLGVTLSDALAELITTYRHQWLDAEQVGQTEMASKLAQRYITDQIFTNTTVFNTTLVYKGKNLVEYTESAWNETTAYTAGQRVLYEDKIYQCILASTSNSPLKTTYWLYITDNLTLYYVTLPVNEWDIETEYAVGNVIWFLDKQYTCAFKNTGILPTSNAVVWGSGTTYSITNKNPEIAWHTEVTYSSGNVVNYLDTLYTCILSSTGNLPTNATYFTALTTRPYWTRGDNRNPLIVRFLLDITRYHFERSIPARNISDNLKEAYDGNGPNQTGGAIGWLKRVNSGTDNLDCAEIIPTQGLSIQFGSSRKAQDNQLW